MKQERQNKRVKKGDNIEAITGQEAVERSVCVQT